MDNTFGNIANQMVSDLSEQGSSPSNDNQVSSNSSSQALSSEREQEVAQALAELDKMDKFKFQGQEWTPKDLEKAILRQKDYTQKTQSLSDERKSFGDERKFYENLAWDLMKLRDNPSMVQEFVKVYPQQFHQYAEQFLKQASNQVQQQGNQGQPPQQSHADVQTLSRLERLEKFYNDQEVAKNETEIKNIMTSMSTKYPDAANFQEMVLGRAYESHTQGTQLTPQVWEDIYKQVNDQVGSMLKTKYGDLVKKQQAANVKARDVGAGGGTVGTAPKKFKGFKEATAAAIADLTNRD